MDKLDIIKVGKQIGFCFEPKRFETDNSYHCFPCKLRLKSKKYFDYVTIYFNDSYEEYSSINLDDILRIEKSEYAIAKEYRQASLDVQDYKGDRPFFLQTEKGKLLGYNAIGVVDFTFSPQYKGKDIVGYVSFDEALKKGFEFIKNHRERTKSIMLKYTDDIVNEINKK